MVSISRPLLWDRYRREVEADLEKFDRLGEHHCKLAVQLGVATRICEGYTKEELCALVRIKAENVDNHLDKHLVGMAACCLVDEVERIDKHLMTARATATASF